MSDLSDVCTLCKADISAVFTAPPRQPPVVISSDVHTSKPCFVADEIEFLDQGKLIFDVSPNNREYAVICRKLTVNGGGTPIKGNPCNSGDPGTRYNNTNVITWNGRLKAANAGGPVSPPTAPASSAHDGNAGQGGATGNAGSDGASLGGGRETSAVKLVVLALDVEFKNGGNLVIDWAGQDGGDGGKGQNGGKGDKGTKGNDGQDKGWPSSGCDTATGDGGKGGDGGPGGKGGNGGKGGDGGQIIIISTPAALSGPFNNPSQISLVTQSSGGKGGPGGFGGTGGGGGNPGQPSSDCGSAGLGDPGANGDPGPTGDPGNPGNALPPKLEAITASACANVIPIPPQFDASNVLPQIVRRCFSGSGNGEVDITGQFLDQVVSVSSSLAGVTATIKASSTDSEIDLNISAAGNSATGVGDLIFTYSFGATATLPGAIKVEVCQATSIAPATVVRTELR